MSCIAAVCIHGGAPRLNILIFCVLFVLVFFILLMFASVVALHIYDRISHQRETD
jgi:hypothetical protein